MHLPQLPDYGKKRGLRKRWKEFGILVFDECDQRADTGKALARCDSKLCQVAAQGVHQHCPLADQQLTDPMQHQYTLLLLALHGDEAHRRSRYRFTDRLCIRRIILLSLHVGLDVRGRHKPNLVTQRQENPSPVVSGRARLDSDKTRRQCLEEPSDIVPAPAMMCGLFVECARSAPSSRTIRSATASDSS